MERVGATNPEYQPLRVLMARRSCAHARKTIPLAPIHPFTKQMVPSLYPESLARSLSRSFSPVLCARLYKRASFHQRTLFTRTSFFFFVCFFVSLFHFHRTLFSWACGSLREAPEVFFSNSLFVHSLLCQITHSFLNGS